MALLNISKVKLSPGLPYMTKAEQTLFKMLEDRTSIFRLNQCEGVKMEGEARVQCSKYVPKHKRFCSILCYETRPKPESEEDDGGQE